MSKHNELGKAGEREALAYLKKKGYVIRHTNWRYGYLELDIVAEKDGLLIVAEIKTRSTLAFQHPEEAVGRKKMRNIVKAAHEYVLKFDWQGETRFDILSVVPRGKIFEIEQIEDAFST
ncbi:MAG: YraN family protein [Prevotellaceae bacterium]|jgi:putative endonuclease|nr:YraN family protein [Prevotellaceae bacterium]